MSSRSAEGPSAEVAARVRAAVAADLRPRPARSGRARLVLAVSAAGIGLALAAVSFGKKLGAPTRHPREMVVALVVLFAGAALLARSLPPFVGRRWDRRGFAAPVGLAAGWGVYLLWVAGTPGGPALPALSCLAVSVAAGAVTLTVGLWAWRNTDPWGPRATGARLGAVAGAVGAAGIGVACTFHGLEHLLVGHGLALLLLAALGAAIAHRTLRP